MIPAMEAAAVGHATAEGDMLTRAGAAARRTGQRYRRLGAVPDARRLLLAGAVANVGDRFTTIAMIALAYELGGGARAVGVVLALKLLPRFLCQAWAGSLVDRRPGSALPVVSHLLLAVFTAAFALLAVLPSVWLLYGLTVARGTVRTVAMPSFEIGLIGVTPPAEYGTARALHSLVRTAGELIGPLLAGLLLPLVGTFPLFLFNALSFLGVAAALAGGRRSAVGPAAAAAVAITAFGYRTLLRRPDVAAYLLLVVAQYVLVAGGIAVFVVRARGFGLGEGGVGMFYSALGAGALVGGAVAGAGGYGGSRVLVLTAAAAIGVGAGTAGFGAAGGLPLSLAALALAGAAGEVEEVSALTGFQRRLGDATYGRVYALFLIATGLGGVAGSLIAPVLAESLGVASTLALLAAPVVGLAGALIVREAASERGATGYQVWHPSEPEVVGYGADGAPPPTASPLALGAAEETRLPRFGRVT
ncbi:MAG: hypothetical protein AVDCRST_MAG73-990 [uncultured Thermomicrobiales bacterium]|uniref:Major facilitator superfamily (MFS) profile domain-containing protein n=1 Tax=uncultured Thermomicrobiales bacterium TaxID=1645740 RepID=A0A6J4TTW8_9BACT|nr:MAG: hypothetical protein AVDCRST_MAG73-990 [uncultured Thermomicrobiales bacterium]